MTPRPSPQPAAATAPLIKDPGALAGVLRRLKAANDGIIFWNEEKSFKLMLRNDTCCCSDADDALACELAVVYDEDDDTGLAESVDMTGDGYLEEPGTYVLRQWDFESAAEVDEGAHRVAAAVNDAYLYRRCPCARYLIKDDAACCMFCHMTISPQERAAPQHMCAICHDVGMAVHMPPAPCCQQRMHARCVDTWRRTSGDQRCPVCRRAAAV